VSSPVADLLRALGLALEGLGLPWYLFGAQAVLLHGGARLTADVDVTVALGDRRIAQLVTALEEAGFSLRVTDVEGFAARTRVLPFLHEPSGLPLDVVLAGPGPEELFLARARPEIIEGVTVPVAAPEDLLVMKILAGRPKDLDDVAAIVAAHRDRLDLVGVRDTLRLFEEALDRRDLLPQLDQLLQRRPK
jgi:hypothetical protein